MDTNAFHILEQIPAAVVVCSGTDHLLQYANKKALAILSRDLTSVLQQPLFLIFPSLTENGFDVLVQSVYFEGKPIVNKQFEYEFIIDGQPHRKYIDISIEPYLDELGQITGINCAINDISSMGILDGQDLHIMTDTIPQLAWVAEADGVPSFFNKGWLKFTGLAAESLVGTQWLELLHPNDVDNTLRVWKHSVDTGLPYEVEYRLRGHDGKYKWFLARGVAARIADGSTIKWYGTTTDISVKKEMEIELESKFREKTLALQKQKSFTDTILDASFHGIYAIKAVYGQSDFIEDFEYLFLNEIAAKYLDIDLETAVRSSMHQIHPQNKKNGNFDLFCEVLKTGKPFQGEMNFAKDEVNQWLIFVVKSIDQNTLVITFQDITEQKGALLKVEQQHNLLSNIMTHSPSGISVTELIKDETGLPVDGKTIVANNISEKLLGLPLDDLLSKKLSELDPNVFVSSFFKHVVKALETGQPFTSLYYFEPAKKWLEFSTAKMDQDRVISIFTDVTVLKSTQQAIDRSAERIRAIFENAHAAMFTFAPVINSKGDVIDFRFVVTNPTFAAYVGQNSETLNGALGSDWFPGYLTNGVFDMYRHTYLTGKSLRKQVHYNVDRHDLFLDIKSSKVTNEVLVTFTDQTPLIQAQVKLEKSVEELRRSNTNLQDFAYAASHDLKEPIRKIKVFAARLKETLSNKLDAGESNYFERMENAAMRMNSLIDDLLFYTEVTSNEKEKSDVALDELIQQVLKDLDLEIEESNALIFMESLPVIKGHERHLQQVFQNLLSNAIKFSRPGIQPHIKIHSKSVAHSDLAPSVNLNPVVKDYHVISVVDNGLGFQQEDSERIFNVFQRLHTSSSTVGTGLGLSIVRKIVENHQGLVTAEGKPGEGAVFTLILPAHIESEPVLVEL